MRKQKKQRTGVRLFPALAAVSILLLVGGYMGFSKAVTAVQGSENDDMQAMMQSMSGMMGDMKEMHEAICFYKNIINSDMLLNEIADIIKKDPFLAQRALQEYRRECLS